MPRPPSDGNAQSRWSAASRRGTKSAGHSLLMPRPEVTAHPATAMRKAGGPRRPDAELSWQVTPCSAPGGHGPPSTAKCKAGGPRRPDAELSWQVTRCSCRPPSDGKAQSRWSAASRRGTKLAGHSLLMPHSLLLPPTQRRQSARQVVRGVPTRNKVGRSLVAHAAPGGRGPPSDGKAQGRWSAASRRGTKSAGHSLLMPQPEVAAHPATAMHKAGGPRRPDAEQRRQDTRCSCRARRSRPTQRRQCARQVVRGVPTRNKAGRSLVAHAAPGGHGPPRRRQCTRQVVRGVPTRN